MNRRSQKHQRGALNSMRALLFSVTKIFSLISRFLEVAQVKRRYQRYQRGSQNSVRQFRFFRPQFFFDISISGGHIGEKKVSTVTTRSPKHYTRFSFSFQNFFFDISICGGQ